METQVPTALESTDGIFASSVQNLYIANQMELPFIDLVMSVPITHTENLGTTAGVQLPFIDLSTSSEEVAIPMCVDEVNSASVKQDDVNGCLKFQTVIGGEQVVSSTPVSDVPETGDHAHVGGVVAAEFLQEYTGDMDEPFVEMSPTNAYPDITVNLVGQTFGDHGKAVECLKYGTTIYRGHCT